MIFTAQLQKHLLNFLAFMFLCGSFGCSLDTRSNRKEMSQHIKVLGERVRSPSSKVDAENALNELLDIATSDWDFAATVACVQIGQLGPLAKSAVSTLVSVVRNNDSAAGAEAIRALGRIGPDASSSVELLIAELGKGNSGSRSWYAAESLGKIGLAALPAIPDLKMAAQSKLKHQARFAREALKKLQKLQENQSVLNNSIPAISTD